MSLRLAPSFSVPFTFVPRPRFFSPSYSPEPPDFPARRKNGEAELTADGWQCRRKSPLNVHFRPGAEGRYLFAPENKGARDRDLIIRPTPTTRGVLTIEALYYCVVGNFFNHVFPLRIPDIARLSHSTRARVRTFGSEYFFPALSFIHYSYFPCPSSAFAIRDSSKFY